nr:hypothetical protein Iba_chr09fCG1300 [Ipomoea batatas]
MRLVLATAFINSIFLLFGDSPSTEEVERGSAGGDVWRRFLGFTLTGSGASELPIRCGKLRTARSANSPDKVKLVVESANSLNRVKSVNSPDELWSTNSPYKVKLVNLSDGVESVNSTDKLGSTDSSYKVKLVNLPDEVGSANS